MLNAKPINRDTCNLILDICGNSNNLCIWTKYEGNNRSPEPSTWVTFPQIWYNMILSTVNIRSNLLTEASYPFSSNSWVTHTKRDTRFSYSQRFAIHKNKPAETITIHTKKITPVGEFPVCTHGKKTALVLGTLMTQYSWWTAANLWLTPAWPFNLCKWRYFFLTQK